MGGGGVGGGCFHCRSQYLSNNIAQGILGLDRYVKLKLAIGGYVNYTIKAF